MGLATHLGPWLLGTVRETTGTTAGYIRNIGATPVCQTKTVAYGDAAASQAFALPAGAMIRQIRLYQTTTFTSGSSGTFTVYVNGTAIAAVTITTGAAGVLSPVASTDAMVALWTNVGTTDAIITYTGDTLSAGAGVLEFEYTVRLPDGSYAPTSFTGP